MKRLTNVIGLMLFCILSVYSQNKRFGMYAVGFYNLENLFDTIHDEGKNDYEFLANGTYKWNGMKYKSKLKNMSTVLSQIGTDKLPNIGASVIGVSEVENDRVMQDLVSQPALKEKGMKFIHIEGPDLRGVDCALLYNPRFFVPEKYFLKYYVHPEDTSYRTRGFLTVQGKLAGDDITFIVCHWPSRFATSYYRELAGQQVRALKDSIMQAEPKMKVIVMGDLNDDPFDDSVSKALGAKREIKDASGKRDMYNPWWNKLSKEGQGTLMYEGKWNLFDQIIMSSTLLNADGTKDYSTLKFHRADIFKRNYLFQTEGRYKGNIKRTTAGGSWLNGYSDHLPVVVYLVKEIQ